MPQFSEDIFLGAAFAPDFGANRAAGAVLGPSPMTLGVGPMGRVYFHNIVPVALNTAGLAAGQLNAATSGSLTLTAGTGVTAVVDAQGVTRYTLDVPRTVTLTVATTNDSGLTFVITGYDQYGQRMTQSRAGPNNNTVSTTKAFKSVTSITYSGGAIATNNLSAGFGDTFGLPVLVSDKTYIFCLNWNASYAIDGGTFTVGDATSPATATTGDVRGTYLPSSASDGVKRLNIGIHLPGTAVGPQATVAGAFGVTQA